MTLCVSDQPPSGTTPGGYYWYPLTSWDYTTSVRETGQPISITGLPAATPTVIGVNPITPFASAIINDDSTNALRVSFDQRGQCCQRIVKRFRDTWFLRHSPTWFCGIRNQQLDSLVFTPSASNLPATTKFTFIDLCRTPASEKVRNRAKHSGDPRARAGHHPR